MNKILITGASGGIGSAITDKFFTDENLMILTSSSSDKLNLLKKKYGDKHFYYLLDFTDPEIFEDTLLTKDFSSSISLRRHTCILETSEVDILLSNSK